MPDSLDEVPRRVGKAALGLCFAGPAVLALRFRSPARPVQVVG